MGHNTPWIFIGVKNVPIPNVLGVIIISPWKIKILSPKSSFGNDFPFQLGDFLRLHVNFQGCRIVDMSD